MAIPSGAGAWHRADAERYPFTRALVVRMKQQPRRQRESTPSGDESLNGLLVGSVRPRKKHRGPATLEDGVRLDFPADLVERFVDRCPFGPLRDHLPGRGVETKLEHLVRGAEFHGVGAVEDYRPTFPAKSPH